jgi:hypothetical protein
MFERDVIDVWANRIQEAEERQIDFREDEPEIVKLMVQYFYQLDYISLVNCLKPRIMFML